MNTVKNYINVTSQNSIGSALDHVRKRGALSPEVNPLTLAEEGSMYYRSKANHRTLTSHGARVERLGGNRPAHLRTFTTQHGTWKSNVKNAQTGLDGLHV